MSPWWREEIIAQLAPAEVTLVHRSRGLQRRELARENLTAGGSDSASWRNVVEAMSAYLEERRSRNAGICVTLRGNLVRYLALPWVETLSERDALVYAQQSFADLFGAAAQQWAVSLSGPVRGAPRIAAATDPELIEALHAHARRLRLKLRSVRPALCAAVQDLARVNPDFTGWLAVIDAGHSCVARFDAGACMTIRTARFAESTERHVLTQLEQDALCAGCEAASGEIYVRAASPFDHASLHAHGWLASPLPGCTLA